MIGRTSKLSAGILVIVVILGALSLLLLTAKSPPIQSLRLKNGTEVVLLQASYATNQTVVTGYPFRRLLYRILPNSFKSRAGVSVLNYNTSQTNNPTFWLQVTGDVTKSPTQGRIRPTSRTRPIFSTFRSMPMGPSGGGLLCRAVDEFGCEYDPRGINSGTQFTPRDGIICYNQLQPPDPHGKIIGMSIYDSDNPSQPVGTFLVPGAVLRLSTTARQTPVD